MSQQRELHPAGFFIAKVLDHGFSSAKTGTPQFWAKFKTDAGDVVGYFAMSDRAAEYTVEKIQAMGFEGTDLQELSTGTVLQGHECQIGVTHDTYNNVTREKVDSVYPIDFVPGPSRDETAAANARRFNALLKKKSAAPGTAPTTRRAAVPPKQDDDEPVPF